MNIAGRAWVLGDGINTDLILPGKYCKLAEPEQLAPHALEGVLSGFARQVKKDTKGRVKGGAIIVAGLNFGCGSSREQAPLALKAAGVSAIVAESFGRIFFRNAINIGIPVMKCAGVKSAVGSGDRICVNFATGELVNRRGGRRLSGEKLPQFMMDILRDGGLVPHLKRRIQDGKV